MGAHLWRTALEVGLIFSYLIIYPTDVTAAGLENIQIVTDPIQVEQFAIAYAEYRRTRRRQVVSFVLQAVPARPTIRNSPSNVKMAFCEFVVQPVSNGIEFDLETYGRPEFSQQPFQVSPAANVDADRMQLPMYSCPRILYTDLETNEKRPLQYVYRISKGRKRRSAIVFFQENPTSPLIPLKYVFKISFAKLARQPRAERISISPPTNLDISMVGTEGKMVAYVNAKRKKAVYEKFKLLYVSLNLCGQRRLHKLQFCRQGVQTYSNHLDLDAHDYVEDACKNVSIRIKLTNNKNHVLKLFVLQCPPTKTLHRPEIEKHPFLYYLSSTLVKNSAILYHKRNLKSDEPQHDCNIDNLDSDFITYDKNRARFLIYPPRHERIEPVDRYAYKKLEDRVNSAAGTVQMPATINRAAEVEELSLDSSLKTIEVIRDRYLIEDVQIAFSQIKKMKLVYQRFRKMYCSLDFCQLSTIERRDLCFYTLYNPQYHLRVDLTSFKIDYKCVRHRISLTSRDATNLAIDTFSIWKCPDSIERPEYKYLLGKSHLRDTVILYKFHNFDPLYFPDNTFYPDAIATKINRHALSQAHSSLLKAAIPQIFEMYSFEE